MRDRDRDAATPRAHVGDAQRHLRVTRQLHRALHEHLCIWIRHQHVRCDLEIQAHELLVADEVRDWLALCPTGDQAAVGGQLAFVQGMVELEIQVQAPQLQSMGEQQLGVEARRVRPMLPEVVGGELQNLNDRHACVSAPPLS